MLPLEVSGDSRVTSRIASRGRIMSSTHSRADMIRCILLWSALGS